MAGRTGTALATVGGSLLEGFVKGRLAKRQREVEDKERARIEEERKKSLVGAEKDVFNTMMSAAMDENLTPQDRSKAFMKGLEIAKARGGLDMSMFANIPELSFNPAPPRPKVLHASEIARNESQTKANLALADKRKASISSARVRDAFFSARTQKVSKDQAGSDVRALSTYLRTITDELTGDPLEGFEEEVIATRDAIARLRQVIDGRASRRIPTGGGTRSTTKKKTIVKPFD